MDASRLARPTDGGSGILHEKCCQLYGNDFWQEHHRLVATHIRLLLHWRERLSVGA